MNLGGAWGKLPQRLVRLLRVGIPAFRKGTLPFPGVLLEHRRVGLLPRLDTLNSRMDQSRHRRNDSQIGVNPPPDGHSLSSWASNSKPHRLPDARTYGGGGSTTRGIRGGAASSSTLDRKPSGISRRAR
jgi:hypothetical protein